MKFKENFNKINSSLAYLSLISLLVSAISGIIVSYHYFWPYPLLSIISMEAKVPFGKFFRNLHYWSSQCALIFTSLHLLDSLYKKSFFYKGFWNWNFLVFSWVATLFATFTGYVLRADETGELAGAIAENLLKSVPIVGTLLNTLFFSVSQIGLYRVFLAHLLVSFILILGLFIFHFSWKRVWRIENLLWIFPSLFLSLFIYRPLNPYQGFKAKGPWFFLGAQELLKFFHPFWVFFFLLFPIFILLAFPLAPSKFLELNLVLFIWLILYFLLSLSLVLDLF
ncbi:MAG: cytochrome b N-terminal domain-containing protein [Thermodesulfobacteriaceae bacterium]|nr:cytochrome b N-terminal domain-containing protein [Thermodesulfobacteriaceae bacterium]MCX8041336.1 cytochrome b N-terminal domain-containing protein [Thermodesulfobacteriaceae bacterium]MDW8135599.1 cytochrome b N-terminal domain-containing protein [Thermodesulfobacterium sp.]